MVYPYAGVWRNSPPFSIAEAEQRGVDLYEVIVQQWGGNPDGDQWPPLGQAPISSSLAAISIGPKSLVDRCWLTWNMQKTVPSVVPNTSELPVTPGDTTGRIRQVSLNSPLLFTQAAASNSQLDSQYTDPLTRQGYTMALLGSLYVWDQERNQAEPQAMIQSTNWGKLVTGLGGGDLDGAYTDINGVTKAFGRMADNVLGGVCVTDFEFDFGWVPPMLHLYLYLKAPLIAPSSQRAPMKISYGCGFTGQQTDAYGANINEQTIGQICVAGRSNVKVAVKSTAAGTFRVGAVKAMGNSSSALPSAPVEWAVDNSGGEIPANTWVYLSSCAGENLAADWLTIYATPTNPAAFPGYQVMVTAVD